MKIKKFNRMIAAVVAIALWPASAPVVAHHSTAEYDQTVKREYAGEVTGVFWKNPHVILHVATTENGATEEWTLEGASISTQTRRGLTADIVKVGDQVRFAGYVSTRRANDMLVENLLLPDGREIFLRGGNASVQWPDATRVALQTGIDPELASQAEADGLFRIWSWGRLQPGWWFFGDTGNFPLTEAALAKHAEWNEFTDNLQLECVAPGMPNTMGNPYPIEFVQEGSNILMRAEEFDVTRTIHMDGSTAENAMPSHLGFSVGHWENENTLVVSTSKINYPYFNRVGVSQSEAVTTLEKFIVDDAKGELHYELTVTDPWALTEPYNWKALWVWRPGEVVATYDCTVEQ